MNPLWATLAALALTEAPRPADLLAKAQKQVEDARLAEAAKTLSALDQLPDLPPQIIQSELLLTGEVNAQLGRRGPASESFRELLFLAPKTVLDDSWGPKVRLVFGEARDWAVAKGSLDLTRCPPTLREGKVAAICAHLGPDPLGLFRGLRFHVARDGEPERTETRPAAPNGESHLDLPAAQRVHYWVEVLGARDAVFAQLGTAAAPLSEEAAPPPKPAVVAVLSPSPPAHPQNPAAVALAAHPEPEPSYRPAAYGLMGGGLAALAAGGVFGWKLGQDRSQITGAATNSQGLITGISQSQAATVANTTRTDALAANVLLGVGAAALVTGAVVWWIGRPEE